MILSRLGGGNNMSYSKLRFALRILDDMKVCAVEERGEGEVSVRICPRAEKTSIENSETYKRLAHQLA